MEIRFEIRANRFPQAPALMRQAIGAAFASQKAPLLSDANRRTPVDTGELRNSESAESDQTSLTLRATAGHAIYVHQGTSRMPPQPFMRTAVESAIPRITTAIVDEAERGLG